MKYKISAQKYNEAGQSDWVVKVWCNIALANIKRKDPETALTYAEKSVKFNPENSKVSI